MSDENKKDANTQSSQDTLASVDVTSEDVDKLNNMFAPKLWLEVMPAKMGNVLAAILTNIMTEGLTPEQENILGNFVSAVGTLISYKASRDDLDPKP